MVTKRILGVALAMNVMMVIGCGEKTTSTAPQQAGTGEAQVNTMHTGGVTAIPCFEFDTQEYLTGFGEFRGSSMQMGELVIQATERAKYNARQKLGGRYQGVISDYRNAIGNNQGNDIATKMEAAGDQVIDRILNDARATCAQQSAVGSDGHMSVYVSLRIYNDQVSNAVAQAVSDKLTEDEKMQIRYDEAQFRERYKTGLQDFSEQNQAQ